MINTSSDTSISCFTACGLVDLACPKEADVDWQLIAQALSRIARFCGLNGDDGAYSVAQHCVLGADALFNETGDGILAAQFLLHDAHEAFLGDITLPVQKYLGIGFQKRFEKLKARWDDVIYSSAMLCSPRHFNNQHLISDMDKRMLAFECKWFFPNQFNREPRFASTVVPRLKIVPKVWGAVKAELEFLDRLTLYSGVNTR